MGFFRKSGLFIVSIILIISLLAMNFCLTLSFSLSYGVIQPELNSFIHDLSKTNNDFLNNFNFDNLKTTCTNNSELNLGNSNSTNSITVPCTVISGGENATKDYFINATINKNYYKEYNCSFWDCFNKIDQEGPFVVVSQTAKNYWTNKFILAFLVSVIILLLILLLVEKKHNFFILSGLLIILASLPFAKMNFFTSFIPQQSVFDLFAIFFSKSFTVFMISLIVGALLIIFGILFRIFEWGVAVESWFEKRKKANEAKKYEEEQKSKKYSKKEK